MSQTDRILAYLRLNRRLCSLDPLTWHPMISRTAARINDLKAEGFEISTSECRMHDRATTRHVVYELATADQGSLF